MQPSTKHYFLWSLPQPLCVFGCAILTAGNYIHGWVSSGWLVSAIIFLPIPMLLILERLIPKRQEWLLNWRELATDLFWVLGTYLIWFPIYGQYYDAPISRVFYELSHVLDFPFHLRAYSVLGTLVMAMIGIFIIEFIGYWVHRLQHRFMFFWRMHATHHHVTKLSVARTDRTHPLEFIGLNLGSVVILAFMDASSNVAAVILVFRLTTAHINHANLPFTAGVFGWLFNTPQWHQLHHSLNFSQSNTNYGCTVILWDRVFGTFSGKENVKTIGNGSGKKLSIWTQLTLPFYSNSAIRKL